MLKVKALVLVLVGWGVIFSLGCSSTKGSSGPDAKPIIVEGWHSFPVTGGYDPGSLCFEEKGYLRMAIPHTYFKAKKMDVKVTQQKPVPSISYNRKEQFTLDINFQAQFKAVTPKIKFYLGSVSSVDWKIVKGGSYSLLLGDMGMKEWLESKDPKKSADRTLLTRLITTGGGPKKAKFFVQEVLVCMEGEAIYKWKSEINAGAKVKIASALKEMCPNVKAEANWLDDSTCKVKYTNPILIGYKLFPLPMSKMRFALDYKRWPDPLNEKDKIALKKYPKVELPKMRSLRD